MKHLPQIAEYIGLLAIVLGVTMISSIAGLIVGGLLCIGIAQVLQWRAER